MMQGEVLLVVEDDATTREVLTLLLQGEGWAVHAVDSGEAALAWLDTERTAPAVVLCDLHLPRLSGEALAERVRAAVSSQENAETFRLIAMTATAGQSRVAGYDAGLLKPFPPAAVEEIWRDPALLQPAVQENEDLPILDEATLRQLRASMGDDALRGLYAFALADAGDRLERMTAAARAGDSTAYVREAHALKGSCGMIGARQLGAMAGDAEMEGLRRDAVEKVLRMHVATQAVRLMLETLFPV